MNSLVNISKQQLPLLKNLYRIDWPLNAVSYAAIEHFIERFEKKPEWEKKVKFLTLNENWKRSGTFVIVNENDQNVMFNTLEEAPYPSLRRTLELLNYDQEKAFVCFRDVFRPLVLDILRVQNLEATFDSSTRCVYLPPERLNEIELSVPEGFHFDSICLSQVKKIDAVWAQRSSHSLEFLTNSIKENPSTGLYNSKNGELVAWCLMLETGAIGNLQVDENYYRRGFGELVYQAQLLKMGVGMKREIVGHIAHQNVASFRLSSKIGFDWTDNNSWIGFKRREAQKLIPLWGTI